MTLLSLRLRVSGVVADDLQIESADPFAALARVAARIARLEARLEQAVGEREELATLVTQQDRRLTELADAMADLTRVKHDARDAIEGILKLVGTLESRLVAQRGG